MSASVLDVLGSLHGNGWVTSTWVAARFGLSNYAARQLLWTLHRRGLVEQATLDEEGKRPYRITGAGRNALANPEKAMSPDRYYEERQARHEANEAHRWARRTEKGRADKEEYKRRLALFRERKAVPQSDIRPADRSGRVRVRREDPRAVREAIRKGRRI